jgi:hypothetical protein
MMSGIAALRAYPNPTRAALQGTATTLRAEVEAATEKWRLADGIARELEQKLREAEEGRRESETKLAKEVEAKLLIVKKIETLSGDLGHARSQVEKVRSNALSRLKYMMSAGLSTKFYQIAVLSDRELIVGKSGTYFSIRLKDQASNAQFIFPKGRYSIPAFEAAILDAAGRLASDIMHALNGVVEYQLFIRGGADAEPLAGPGDLSPDYSAVLYRPLGDGGKYAAKTEEHSLRAPINNNDLPVLRAAYFRSLIADRLTPQQIDVLHNVPSKEVAEEHRTVELILYVNW